MKAIKSNFTARVDRPKAVLLVSAKLVLLLCLFAPGASAQQQRQSNPAPAAVTPTPASATASNVPVKETATAPAASSTTPTPSPASDGRYRIGAGDVLDIRFVKNPDLSRDNVRVDNRGMIRMPMLSEDIPAACLTEGELAQSIAKLYLKYKRNPHIDVFVKEYNSKPVAVMGAVVKPGRFQLQREIRLLELLTQVEGASERAGGRVQIVHTETVNACEAGGAASAASRVGESEGADFSRNLAIFKLEDTLKGDPKANPIIRPGDIISISDAEQAYVVGNVLRPGTITLKEPVTISRAIAMSGGLMPDTKSEQVKIIRQVPGSLEKIEVVVNLKAITKHQAPDVPLLAGDVVDVPTSGGKRLLRSLIGTIAPTVGQLPVQVIR
ncbi:MAG TPA: polysaccharide biosynthesis/export family protein [Pyrinomonadaceae bacterium]|jgi:polysaccharide export outer membrane protein